MEKLTKILINKLENDFINSEGLLSSSFPPNDGHLLNDFNDYIPFMSYYGSIDFVDQQFSISKGKEINGLIANGNRIISWRQDEWLEAIYERYMVTGDGDLKDVIDKGLNFISERMTEKGLIKAFYNLKSHKDPAVFDPRTGALLETLLDMGKEFPKGFDLAVNCLDSIINWSNTADQYLIPDHIFYKNKFKSVVAKINPMSVPTRYLYPYADGWRSYFSDCLFQVPFSEQITLAKQNSNLIHAFIRAYMLTNEEKYLKFIKNWFTAMKKYMYDDGRCYSFLNYNNKKYDVKLSHNHPVIEICLDMYMLTNQRPYLELAIKILEYWFSVKCPNGLFPKFDDSDYSFIDDQTDMIVLLIKLSGILKEPKYIEEAEKLYNATIKNHLTNDGLITFYGFNSTRKIEPWIEPKYNALFLKAAIALEKSDDILLEEYWLLFRDR